MNIFFKIAIVLFVIGTVSIFTLRYICGYIITVLALEKKGVGSVTRDKDIEYNRSIQNKIERCRLVFGSLVFINGLAVLCAVVLFCIGIFNI